MQNATAMTDKDSSFMKDAPYVEHSSQYSYQTALQDEKTGTRTPPPSREINKNYNKSPSLYDYKDEE